MARNLVLGFLRYFLPPLASRWRMIRLGQNSHSLLCVSSCSLLFSFSMSFIFFFIFLLVFIFFCFFFFLPLLSSLLFIFLFFQFFGRLTRTGAFRTPQNLSSRCPKERLTSIHGVSSRCGLVFQPWEKADKFCFVGRFVLVASRIGSASDWFVVLSLR